MAIQGYIFYGGGAGDFAVTIANTGDADATNDYLVLAPGAQATVHTAATSGSQITTLYDADDSAVTEVTADSDGTFHFQAPAGLGTLYLRPYGDGGVQGSKYYPIQQSDVGDELAAVKAALADAQEALRIANEARIVAEVAVQDANSAATIANKAANDVAAYIASSDSITRAEVDGLASTQATQTTQIETLTTDLATVKESADSAVHAWVVSANGTTWTKATSADPVSLEVVPYAGLTITDRTDIGRSVRFVDQS